MQRKLVLLLGIVAAVSAIAIAGSDSDDATATPDSGHAEPDNIGLLAVLSTLTNANLHHIESALIADEAQINPAWIAPIVHARTAVALIGWPEELHTASENFLADSMPLLIALQEDDLDTAVEHAPSAHSAWHLLRDPGYAYLAEVAGTGSMGDDGHAHEDGESDDEMAMSDDS